MRKALSILSILLLASLAHAQSVLRWQQIYGGSGVETGYGVRSCPDQGYIAVGTSSSLGPSDGYIVRTDSVGLLMWFKYYGGVNIDVIRSIKLLPDSGYICAGYTNSFGNGGYDGWVLRIDKFGDTLWTRTAGTTDWDFFYDVTPTWDGGFICAGGTYGQGNGQEDMYFVKLDSMGVQLWDTTWGGSKDDEARGIIEIGDSTVVTSGYTYSLSDTLGESWVLKLDPATGDTIWTITAGFKNAADKSWGLTCWNAAQWIYFGGEHERSPGNKDAYFGILSFAGDSLSSFTTGGAQEESFNAMVTRPDGMLAAGGTDYTVGAGSGDFYVFHTVGNWMSWTYGTSSLEECFGIDVTHDLGYITCGYTEGFNSYQANLYLIKTDTAGQSPNILDVRDSPQQNEMATSSVFPNPASGTIQLTYDAVSPISSNPVIRFFDISGNEITLNTPARWSPIGSNSATCILDVTDFANGIYFYSIAEGSTSVTQGSLVVIH